MDVGGDEVGARVLGSLADVVPVDDTDCWLVLNFRRPSTPDPECALRMTREIEAVGKLSVAGLISNTHLMDETTPAVVLDGYHQAVETAALADVPVIAVTVTEELAVDLRDFGRLDVVAVDRTDGIFETRTARVAKEDIALPVESHVVDAIEPVSAPAVGQHIDTGSIGGDA